jgi:hypothetical protein
MHALTAAELLSVWENGVPLSLERRAVTMLSAALPEVPPPELARLPIGQRDALILTLRERTFGPRLSCMVTCSSCGERAEFDVDISDIQITPSGAATEPLSLRCLDYEVKLRLPNSLDLESLPCEDPALSWQWLLERCVLSALRSGEPVSPGELPEEVVRAVVSYMEQADPQAHIEIAITCSACGNARSTMFDILYFFWVEITAWAQRTLRSVHSLARAYGWSESEILAMSPWKRQFYLEMVDR